MDKKEILPFIKTIELFKGLKEDELQLLATELEERKYRRGEFLFREHEPREEVFIIYKGEVELIKVLPTGAEKKLVTFHEGDFLGEGAIAGDVHSTSARAVEDSQVLILERDYFFKHGKTFELYSFFGKPVSSGTYSGFFMVYQKMNTVVFKLKFFVLTNILLFDKYFSSYIEGNCQKLFIRGLKFNNLTHNLIL